MEGTYSGIYYYGFEASVFHASEIDEIWWLSPADGSFDDFIEDYSKRLDQLGEEYAVPLKYRITAKGTVSKKGQHGHLGGFERNFVVNELLQFEWIEEESN